MCCSWRSCASRRPLRFPQRSAAELASRLSSLGWAEPEVVLALRLAAVAAALCVIVRLLRWRPPAPLRLSALVLLPTAASFLFCLGTTPMPRYFGATLWLLPAQLLLAGAGDLVSARRWARGALVWCGSC